MSDIQILLSELIEKIENLEQKIDILSKKVDKINVVQINPVWGDDSRPFHTRPEQIIVGDVNPPNPFEITCKGE